MLGAEAFVDAMRPMRMGEVSVAHITAFFPRYAREQRLNEWQYRQTVEAVQLLLVDLAQCRAATEVDWDFWKEAGKGLDAGHPTVAAGLSPDDAVESQPRFSRSSEQVPLLKSLARTLRARRCAIRTEQSDVDCTHRFLLFTAGKEESQLVQADVERFLGHLATERSVSASTQNQALNAHVFPFPVKSSDRYIVAYQPPKITASGISYRSSPMWTMLRSDSLLALKAPLSAWLWS